MVLDKGKDLVNLGTEKALTLGKDLVNKSKDLALIKRNKSTQ